MNARVAQKLLQFVKAGATIIGPKPVKANGLNNSSQNDEIVKSESKSLWGGDSATGEKVYGKGKVVWNKTLKQVLLQKGIKADVSFKSASNTNTFDFIHRQAGTHHIYFIRNTNPDPVTALFLSG